MIGKWKKAMSIVLGIIMVTGSIYLPETKVAKAAEETYGKYTANCSSSDYPNRGKAVEVRFRNTETGNTDVYLIEAYRKSTDANIKGNLLTTQRSFYLKTEHISGNGEFNFTCPSYTTLKFAEDGESYAVMDLPCTIDVPAYLRQLGNGANAGVPDIAYGGRFGANTYNRIYGNGTYTMPRGVKTSKTKRNIQLQINIANFRIVESTANKDNRARQTWCFQYNKVGISFFANGAISNSTTGYSVVNNVVNAAGSRYYQYFTYDGKSAINLVNASTLGLVKRGYHFVDWYSDNTAQHYNQDTNYSNSLLYNNWTSNKAVNVTNVDDAKGLNGSSSLVTGGNMWAQWAPDIYHITYDLNGGTNPGNPATYNIETSTFTLKNPTREGYDFLGWSGSNISSRSSNVTIHRGTTGNLSFKANFAKKKVDYKITFDPMGGKIPKADKIEKYFSYNVQENLTWGSATNNKDTIQMYPPTKEGYTFEGWYYQNGKPFSFDDVATQNQTIEAHWKAISYPITYKLNGGDNPGNPDTYTIETEDFTLKNPTRNGYEFLGWTGSNGTEQEKTVTISKGSTGAKQYEAHWKAISYHITYDLQGGTDPKNPETYTIETEDFTLKNPTRRGYEFLGWTGSNGKSADRGVTVKKGTTGDLHYEAHWKLVGYHIRYVLNGGTDPKNPSGYMITTPTFLLKNPTKTGYTLKGWTGSNGSTPGTAVSVLQGTTGNLSFTANWVKNIIKIKKVPIKKMPYLNTVKYINKGSKFTFKVYGSKKNYYKIFWKNSNPKVISLSSKGLARAKKNGKATVGYQIYNKKTGKLVYGFQIKVRVITTKYKTLNTSKSIKVNRPTFMFDKTLFVGGKFKLGFHNLEKGAKVTYKSSNKKILTISKNGLAKGMKEGFAYVTIKVVQNGIHYEYRVHFKTQERFDFSL